MRRRGREAMKDRQWNQVARNEVPPLLLSSTRYLWYVSHLSVVLPPTRVEFNRLSSASSRLTELDCTCSVRYELLSPGRLFDRVVTTP